ncbi:MAG TPA: MFS transporter [Clostridia bacterium]
MPYKYRKLLCTSRNKSFILLLISQGISNLGDSFQLVAATTLMVSISGSGMAAGFALIFSSIPSVILSPFAGILGDKLHAKGMLITIDILRSLAVILFTVTRNITAIYFLILILSSFDILYGPARNKIISCILEKKDMISAASKQSGIFGAAFLAGPILAGVTVGLYGVNTAFIINSLSFFLSAAIILFIKENTAKAKNSKFKLAVFVKDFVDIFSYCLKMPQITRLLESGFFISFGAASINAAFYSFAFDTIGVTGKQWSIILSTLYGTNIIAMFISMLLVKRSKKTSFSYVYILMVAVSGVWFCYSISKSLLTILLLLLVEGTSMSLIGILLSGHLLMECKKSFVARVTAISDLINNSGRLASYILTFVMIGIFKDRTVFLINSIILFVFAAYSLVKKRILMISH